MRDKTQAPLLRDMGRLLRLGLLLDGGCTAVLFAAGLCAKAFSVQAAWQVVRSGLFVLGGLSLLAVAGMVLLGTKNARVQEMEGWKRHFKRLGLLPVGAGLSVMLLAAAIAVDYLLYWAA